MSAMLPNSTLLNSCNQVLDQSCYHVSLGDTSAKDIITVSNKFDSIEFVNIGFDHESDLWNETKLLLNYLSHQTVIKNFTKSQPETFVESDLLPKVVHDRHLWVFGCSHSHGFGLTSLDQRYGSIVAKNLNLPVSFVTKPGSSLQWSLRHLVNSNINPNHVVIWQLTTPQRVTLYNGEISETLLSSSRNRYLSDTFNEQQIFFHHCSLVNYGVNYLRALGVKFVMTSILNKSNLFYQYLDQYTKYPEYCHTPDAALDLGTDHLHVGPLSHQALAQRILDHINYTDD